MSAVTVSVLLAAFVGFAILWSVITVAGVLLSQAINDWWDQR